MRIAVVGAGSVGSALGGGWLRAGHQVTFAVRNTAAESAQAAAALGGTLVTLSEARDADAVVLAVPWTAIDDTLASLGDLTDRLVIDATNPVAPPYTDLAVAGNTSGAEVIQQKIPQASVVKAFNQSGWENLGEAISYTGQRPVMFAAGDDDRAKAVTLGLARDLGFEAIDAGPLSMSRYLEPLAMLWIRLANAGGLGRSFAFALVRR